MKLFAYTNISVRAFFVAIVCSAPLFALTSDKVGKFESVESTIEVRELGWPEVEADAKQWLKQGVDHEAYSHDDEVPSKAAIEAALRARCAVGDQLVRPDVWGSAGDGGYYIEQHDANRVVLLWIAPNGVGHLSVLIDGVRQGEVRTI